MSVIAIKKERDKITIASDSQITNISNDTKLYGDKIIKSEDAIICYTGNSAYGSLIKMKPFKLENPLTDLSDLYKSVYDYVELLDVCKHLYNIGETNQQPVSKEDEFLFIINGDACYYNNGYVCYYNNGYVTTIPNIFAIGSGAKFALGALEAGADVKQAVEIACKHDLYCSGDIKFKDILL